MEANSSVSQRVRRYHFVHLPTHWVAKYDPKCQSQDGKKWQLATTFAPPQKDLERLIDAQKNSSTPVHIVVISGDSCGPLRYTENTWRILSCFASGNNSCAVVIDTTFKLCNIRITSLFLLTSTHIKWT